MPISKLAVFDAYGNGLWDKQRCADIGLAVFFGIVGWGGCALIYFSPQGTKQPQNPVILHTVFKPLLIRQLCLRIY